MCDSSSSPFKANTTAKEDGQNDIRKCSSKINCLKIEKIEPKLKCALTKGLSLCTIKNKSAKIQWNAVGKATKVKRESTCLKTEFKST